MEKQGLAAYRAKRDFSKTEEPSGAESIPASERLRFVIQKHAATRLHYDLRLELDGVFKSWAVTKGPSRDPKERRLAVEVEDHPLDYGDFEGTIPKGQYGGGTVMLWDRGYWAPMDGRSPQEALRKGELKFVMAGEKIEGSWVLVRLKPDRERGRNRSNWLLIKHHDGYEKEGDADALLAQDRSVASGRTMEDIAAGKGRAPKPFMAKRQKKAAKGFGANAVWQSNRSEKNEKLVREAPSPGAQLASTAKAAAMPEFVSPQLCKLVERPPAGDGWAHEIKFDGYRMQLRVAERQAALRTRKGLDWTDKYQPIADAATALPDCIIDGEIVALDHKRELETVAVLITLRQNLIGDLAHATAADIMMVDAAIIAYFNVLRAQRWLGNLEPCRRAGTFR